MTLSTDSGTPSLGVTVTCMGCDGDITPRGDHTYATCRTCEDQLGFEPFERGQRVRVVKGWIPMEEGDTDIAGLAGLIIGRHPGGAFSVALAPETHDGAYPFALYDEELEAIL